MSLSFFFAFGSNNNNNNYTHDTTHHTAAICTVHELAYKTQECTQSESRKRGR